MATRKTTRKSTPAGRSPRSAKASPAKSAEKSAPKPAVAPTKAASGAKLAVVADQTATAGTTAATGSTVFKRQDLIQALAARSSVKKSEIREVMELMLDEMGKALSEGRELVLPPFGKLAVKKVKPHPKGDVLISRIKLHKPKPQPGLTPLASTGEDD